MRPGTDQSPPGPPTKRLLTVHEAAEALGLTVEAVRSRMKRGTLAKEKGRDGTVYVVVEGDQARPDGDQTDDRNRPGDDQATAQALLIARLEEQVEHLRQEVTDWKQAAATRDRELDDQVDYLRRQLEVWQEEARRKDHIIAALTERIPELEPAPSQEASESPLTASEERGKGEGRAAEEGPHKSFWRKLFG